MYKYVCMMLYGGKYTIYDTQQSTAKVHDWRWFPFLACEVPRIVAALRDELWPVREAALQTLRKLRPEQLQRLSREVLHAAFGERIDCFTLKWAAHTLGPKWILHRWIQEMQNRTEDFWLFTISIPTTVVWRVTAEEGWNSRHNRTHMPPPK